MGLCETVLTLPPRADEALQREPVTVGIPFPQGLLRAPDQARLLDGEDELYCQRRALASWPDGSVRWLLVDFQVDLPAGAPKRLRVACDQGAAQSVLSETGVTLADEGERIVLDNGPLRIVGRKSALALLESVCLGGKEVLAPGQSQGFGLVDLAGRAYSTARCREPRIRVEAAGPLRAAVRFEGSHVDGEGRSLLDFSILLTTWSDKPYAAVDYQVVHRGGEQFVELHEMAYEARFGPGSEARPLVRPEALSEEGEGGRRIDIPPAQAPAPDGPGEAAPWAGRVEAPRGIALAIRHAVAQRPKRLAAAPDLLRLDFYPPSERPLRLHQGSAKSHQLLLYAFAAGEGERAIERRVRLFDRPVRPAVPAAWHARSGAFGSPLPAKSVPRLSQAVGEALRRRPRPQGVLDFGDEPLPPPPEAPQARAWSNNAFDLAHGLCLHHALTAEEAAAADAEALVRHVLDVDHVHFSPDPLCDGGLAAPDAGHWRGGLVSPAHQWVEGLLDHYHATGCWGACRAVRRVGENVLRHVPALLARPLAEGPLDAVGWALYTVATLYRELDKPQYFDAARKLVDHVASGGVPPDARPAALAVVLTGLHRYGDVAGEVPCEALFLEQLDALLDRAQPLGGEPEHALLLDPLAYAHQLSGERRYLEAGLPLIRWLFGEGPLASPEAEAAACPVCGTHLALAIRPLLTYLAAYEASGQLDALGPGPWAPAAT
ncbi:MAG: hypothetical protein ACLF0G_13640 [Candidatus Brocadiia bacterium]